MENREEAHMLKNVYKNDIAVYSECLLFTGV